jgi:hypothetical protein
VIKDSMVRVALHRQFASHYAFEKNGLRTSVTPGSGPRSRPRAGR